jgi:hypothetical protein
MPRRDDAPAAQPPAPQYRRIDKWWKPGDPKPMIDSSAPAVAQAIGRCLTWRVQRRGGTKLSSALHPRECGWCAYRDADLQAAIGYAAFVSRYDEVGGEYHNEEWARFFAGITPLTRDLPPDAWFKAAARRHAAIEDAMYGGLE